MSEQPEKPKKPRRSKKGTKKVTLNSSRPWKELVESAEKTEVPIDILQEIEVRLIDGTSVVIDIKKLLNEGVTSEEIELMLNEQFEKLDSYIETVDFFIDISKVADVVLPETKKVLKGL